MAGEVPQYLRIEIEQDISLPTDADVALRAILQYGVFVDGGAGASSKGTPTQVLIYRKLFSPVFPTTVTSGESFSWTTATFCKFLRNPQAAIYDEGRRTSTGELYYAPSTQQENLEDLEHA
jgi:hypothetical protein